MTMLALHRRSLLGFVALGPLGLISGSPILLGSGLVVLALIGRSLRSFGEANPGLFARVVIHALTVLGLLGALLLFRTDRVDAVLLILLLGLTNRLLLRAGQRDDFLLIALTSTMIAAATTVTPGIEFLLIVIAAVPALVLALWTSELLGSVERDPIELAKARRRPSPPGMSRWVAIAMVMTVLGTLLCALFPRYKFSRILGAGAFVRLPGASDAMRLDNAGTSGDDDGTVVLRIYPDESLDREDLDGLYARVFSLEDFDGVNWTRREHGNPYRASQMHRTGRKRARVALNRLVPGSSHPVAVIGRDAPFALHSHLLKRDDGGHLAAEFGRSRQLEYHVSVDEYLREPAPSPNDPGLLSLREDLDPRLAELSKQLVQGADSDERKIERVLGHFSRGYTYSTDPMEGTEANPLARFLFESKKAHCELYAAAVAVLLRSAGVRARVATGYYGGRWNRAGSHLAFVQGDAHAWVEGWSEEDQRWRWVDATPEDLRGRRATFDLWALARDWYDTVSAAWYERVVDFDGRRQKLLYQSAMDRVFRLADFAKGLDSSAKDRATSGSRWLVLLALGGGALAALVGLPALLVVRRRRSPRALGQRLRKALGADAEVDGSRTLGQLLGRQPEALHDVAERAIRRYEEHRFGPAEATSAGPLVAALEELEEKRRQNREARD